ncbi:MAG: hypothetical protein A3K13_08930 [Gemmatimonadetes bacterium RIFCSPLOWO2_12_FULL_68_9]|nr:MAG: hypothetical protein A3K13_08930 [Gemmatimonadetes bacterium RIFCSPLOWO2_12_FULL_68_9]
MFPELEIKPLREAIRSGDGRALVVLFGAAGLLLLVTWVQVAALTFSGALGRLQEVGIRLALGAGRARLVRQFAVEHAIVAAAAFVVAWMAVRPLTIFVVSMLPAELRRGQYLEPELRTFVFGCAVSLVGLGLLTVTPIGIVRRAAPLGLLSGRIGSKPVSA